MDITWTMEDWAEVCRVLEESQSGLYLLRVSGFGIPKPALADLKTSILLHYMRCRIQKLAFHYLDWVGSKEATCQFSGLENVEELSLSRVSWTASDAQALATGMQKLPKLRRLCIETCSQALKLPSKLSEVELFLRLNDCSRNILIDWFHALSVLPHLERLWLRLTPSTAEPLSLTPRESREFAATLKNMTSLQKLYIVTPLFFQTIQDFELVLGSLHELNALQEVTFLFRFPPNRIMEARMREYLVHITEINRARAILPNHSRMSVLGCVKHWWYSTLMDEDGYIDRGSAK